MKMENGCLWLGGYSIDYDETGREVRRTPPTWSGHFQKGDEKIISRFSNLNQYEDLTVNSPANTVAADIAKVVAWYKSKPLYAGMCVGFLVGQAVYHFLKI